MALTSSMCRLLPNPQVRVLTPGSRLIHGSRGNSQSPSRKNQPSKAERRDQEHGSNKRWLTYNHTSKPTPQSIRERNITVSSYYNQTAIDEACQQNSIRLTPSTIMYTGSQDGSHIMKSAKYLRRYYHNFSYFLFLENVWKKPQQRLWWPKKQLKKQSWSQLYKLYRGQKERQRPYFALILQGTSNSYISPDWGVP